MSDPRSRKTGFRAQLLRGGSVMVVGRGLGLFAGLLVTAFLARRLGASGYGLYALAQSIVALLAVPTQLGLPTLLIRETALAAERRDYGVLHGLLRWALTVVLGLGVLLGLLAFALAHLLAARFGPEFLPTFLWALVFLGISATSLLLQGALQGVRCFALAMLPDMLLVPGLFAILVAASSHIPGWTLTPARAMALYAACAALSLAIVLAAVRLRLPPEVWRARPRLRVQPWLAAALPLCATAALTLCNSQLVVVLVGSLGTPRDAGLYRVAASGAAMAVIVGATLGGVVGPHIATLHARGDRRRLAQLAVWSAWLGALPALGLLALYALAGERLLGFAFGPSFVAALPALLILTLGQTVNAATGVVHTLLNMTGFERDTLRGVALGASSALVLSFTLIPTLGLVGAAVAATTAIVAENLYLAVRVRERLSIESSILSRGLA